ncbi:MAG: hypothetical protein HY589_01315, partial [Candidatus Omnitrophica bacterium]|nr:hypothetical protein [Candidatus Omnitrophota bacterium]
RGATAVPGNATIKNIDQSDYSSILRPLALREKNGNSLPAGIRGVGAGLNGKANGKQDRLPLIDRVRAILYRAALKAGGSKTRAAELLGVHINTFSRNYAAYTRSGCLPDDLSASWEAALFTNGTAVDLREISDNITSMLCRAALDATGENISYAARLIGVARSTLVNYRRKGAIPDELDERWFKALFEEIIGEQFFSAGVNIFDTAAALGVDNGDLYEVLLEHRTDVVSAGVPKTAPEFQQDLFMRGGRPFIIDRFSGMLCRLALERTGGNKSEAAKLLNMSRSTFGRYVKSGIIPDTVDDNWKGLLLNGGIPLTIEEMTGILYRVALNARVGNEARAARLLGISRNTIRRYSSNNLIPSVLDAGWQDAFFKRKGLIPAPKRLDYDIVGFIDWIGNAKIKWLSDDQLKTRTEGLRQALASGASLNGILPEAFAVFREAAFRSVGMRPTTEQVLAALGLHRGMAVEMLPGEGKTLSIAMAAYLNALTGRGAHIHTFNDFLAKRDGQDMGTVFAFLGLTTGVIVEGRSYAYFKGRHNPRTWMQNLSSKCTRREAYLCDITYGEKDEFVFDYLRDNLVLDPIERRQSKDPPSITIVDEGDSTLIDEGYEPLILSTEANGFLPATYAKIYVFATEVLHKRHDGKIEYDYEIDEQNEGIILSDAANGKIRELFAGIKEVKGLPFEERNNLIYQALKAKFFYHRDEDYVVRGKKIVIVDEFTGRFKRQHVWGNFIHQFVQAKEGVNITPNFLPSATITYQSYYRRMKALSKLAIISGTIGEDARELSDVYALSAVGIPLQQEFRRDDWGAVYCETEVEKNQKVIECVRDTNRRGNPILVFAPSIREARRLHDDLGRNGKLLDWLRQWGAHLNIMDGTDPDREAAVIKRAGHRYEITIATNAAGRGIHFELGAGVNNLEPGGLIVIMTYRNKIRRIDSQQRRRTAIRGDNGGTRTFLSWEDEIFRRWGRDEPQERSEEYYRALRARTLDFDAELDKKREEYYRIREIVLSSELDAETKKEKLKAMDGVWRELLISVDTVRNIRAFKKDCFDRYREVCKKGFSSLIYRLLDSKSIGLRMLIPELAAYGLGAGLPDADPATRPVVVDDLGVVASDVIAISSSILRPRAAGERREEMWITRVREAIREAESEVKEWDNMMVVSNPQEIHMYKDVVRIYLKYLVARQKRIL